MQYHNSYTLSNFGDDAFDLSQIFIGRQQQLDLFEIYLDRWQRLMHETELDCTSTTSTPSPDKKIQGLVTMLYGRGGFGKSTLLRHYRNIALREGHKFNVSEIINWEFAVEGKRGLFNPPQGQEVEASEYFKVLQGQLAIALDKKPHSFKEYQSAVKDVEKARKDIHSTLDSMQKDDRYGWLRGLAIEAVTTAIRTYIPGSKVVLDNEKVKDSINEVAKITQEQLTHILPRLQEKLGNRLDDYLDPALKLGLALGHDLCEIARNFPLIILFDTYEEIDEADLYLRTVMGAAGLRVGWIIAGRDNLWAGTEQRERSLAMEYGYKDIVPLDRGLSINFNANDVGAFTFSDIIEYFSILCKSVVCPLPQVLEEGAAGILNATQGVPLAVKIAAGLYVETADLNTIIEKVEGKKEIVDQMVRRYLLHTRINESERAKLYGLALLRRTDQPTTVAAALGLTPEEAKTNYAKELSQLHRRYSFIFTDKEYPLLHQEVRHFLRLWLLEHSGEPHIGAINERLIEAHETALIKLEERMNYSNLKERLQDNEWINTYLGLTEQKFWLDPTEGIHYMLPFMIAAAVYSRETNKDALETGKFFISKAKPSYHNWWNWASQSLITTTSRNSSVETCSCLKELEKLANQRSIAFPSPLPDFQNEVEALLWWRLGEAYRHVNKYIALEWYEKSLVYLKQESDLQEAIAKTCVAIATTLNREKEFAKSIPFLTKAIELLPDYSLAYSSRGINHSKLNQYDNAIQDYTSSINLDPTYAPNYVARGINYANLQKYDCALQDYTRAIDLDPKYANAYYRRGDTYFELKAYDLDLNPKHMIVYLNRGNLYARLKKYELAIEDYTHVLKHSPKYSNAYYKRGNAYLWMRNSQQARADYRRACEFSTKSIYTRWMAEWAEMNKTPPSLEMAEKLEIIAKINSNHYAAHICRGIALGLRNRLREGLAELEQAIHLNPTWWDAYFWKGILCAYYYRNRPQVAVEVIEKALEIGLPPILLTPLYWLEKDVPLFFQHHARLILEKYNL